MRKAKADFKNQASVADELYEDDCVVEETDPEEMSYPKHEPAIVQSKNKASNLSQHTSSVHKAQAQKSPKNGALANVEPTDALLKVAYLREQ